MELKDVILSTLAEMEEEVPAQAINNITNSFEVKEKKVIETMQKATKVEREQEEDTQVSTTVVDSELIYLTSIRDRLLVLFEGFQAPNNTNIEAKVDMTLNFLEYVLATIDSRMEKIEREEL